MWNMMLLALSAAISVIVYYRGPNRAFAIGCAPPLALTLFDESGFGLGSPSSFYPINYVGLIAVTLLAGFISMRIRERSLPIHGEPQSK